MKQVGLFACCNVGFFSLTALILCLCIYLGIDEPLLAVAAYAVHMSVNLYGVVVFAVFLVADVSRTRHDAYFALGVSSSIVFVITKRIDVLLLAVKLSPYLVYFF